MQELEEQEVQLDHLDLLALRLGRLALLAQEARLALKVALLVRKELGELLVHKDLEEFPVRKDLKVTEGLKGQAAAQAAHRDQLVLKEIPEILDQLVQEVECHSFSLEKQ
jgi:hypothetical protein